MTAGLKSAACRPRAFRTLFQDSLVDFFSVNLDLWRSLDPDSYLITFYAQYRYSDIITDDKFFPNSSCQNEHYNLPMVSDSSVSGVFLSSNESENRCET